MKKLCEYEFQWILAGHGDRKKLPSSVVKEQLIALVAEMKLKA